MVCCNKIIYIDVIFNCVEFDCGYVIFVILCDISVCKCVELLQSEQNWVLYMVMVDDDLDGIFNEIIGFVDVQIFYGVSCVMLVNE